MAMVVCTQSSENHPSNGLPSAMRRDSGCTQGLLTSLSSTKTNFTTTQVSQIGSRVSSQVSRAFLNPCRGGALCGGMLCGGVDMARVYREYRPGSVRPRAAGQEQLRGGQEGG